MWNKLNIWTQQGDCPKIQEYYRLCPSGYTNQTGQKKLLTEKTCGGICGTEVLLKNEKTEGSREAISFASNPAEGDKPMIIPLSAAERKHYNHFKFSGGLVWFASPLIDLTHDVVQVRHLGFSPGADVSKRWRSKFFELL